MKKLTDKGKMEADRNGEIARGSLVGLICMALDSTIPNYLIISGPDTEDGGAEVLTGYEYNDPEKIKEAILKVYPDGKVPINDDIFCVFVHQS